MGLNVLHPLSMLVHELIETVLSGTVCQDTLIQSFE